MAVIRENTFDGPGETAITTVNSGDHGNAFDHVDATGVTYDDTDPYQGTAAMRLDQPDASHGVAWQSLSLTDCALRVYIKRSADAESGNVWWANAPGSGEASLGAGGDLGWSGILLEDALPADTWCRVEATRDGSTATLSVWSTNPESTGAPDATDTATVATDTITQWWLEHMGAAVYFDAWALGDTADEIGPVGVPVNRTNSCDGTPGVDVTTAESGDHGNAWNVADTGITYSATSYAGAASIRLPAAASGTGVAWTALEAADFAARGYLHRDDTAEDGHISWADAVGGASLTAGGGITWAGLSVAGGSVPAQQWVRVELRRVGSTGHLEVYSDPQSLTPSASDTGTITTDTVTQWWWERFGTGSVRWDELALVTGDGSQIGPITLPAPSGFTGVGMPMFAEGT